MVKVKKAILISLSVIVGSILIRVSRLEWKCERRIKAEQFFFFSIASKTNDESVKN